MRITPAAAPGGRRTVVLSLSEDSVTDLPLPDIASGDRLRLFVELEVTTDYEDPNADGLVGTAYSYAPKIEAGLLVAKDPNATAPRPGRAVLVGERWLGECSHQRHHLVIPFGDFGVDADDLDWAGPYFVNVTLSASHPSAKPRNVLLVGQNEPTGHTVGIDMSGIRVVRLRPGDQPATRPTTTRRPSVGGIPVNPRGLEDKVAVVVYSQPVEGLKRGEQLLIKARLNTDSSALGYAARVSTRLFLADSETQTEPGGTGKSIASWGGHISKPNGSNTLPADGPRPSAKYGVVAVNKSTRKTLYVNLVAVSAEPFGGMTPGDKLRVAGGGFLEITRYPAALNG